MSERNIKQLVLEQLRNTKIPKSDRKNISTSKDARGFALGLYLFVESGYHDNPKIMRSIQSYTNYLRN